MSCQRGKKYEGERGYFAETGENKFGEGPPRGLKWCKSEGNLFRLGIMV